MYKTLIIVKFISSFISVVNMKIFYISYHGQQIFCLDSIKKYFNKIKSSASYCSLSCRVFMLALIPLFLHLLLLQEMILTYILAYVYHLSPDFLSFTQIMFPLGYIAHGHIVHGPEDTTYMATYLLLIQPDMATNFRPIKSIPAKQKTKVCKNQMSQFYIFQISISWLALFISNDHRKNK